MATNTGRLLLAVSLLAGVSGIASTTARADDCSAVSEALLKLATTPVHETVLVDRSGTPGGTSIRSELIQTGDTRYIQLGGKWVSRPYDARKEAADLKDRMQSEKRTCSKEKSEAVDGEDADVYAIHTTAESGDTDMRVWLSTARKLPLKVVGEQGGDGPARIRHEIHMDYVNVSVPADAAPLGK
jgi:hypothetical protein